MLMCHKLIPKMDRQQEQIWIKQKMDYKNPQKLTMIVNMLNELPAKNQGHWPRGSIKNLFGEFSISNCVTYIHIHIQ